MEPNELLARKLTKKIPKGFKCAEQWALESGMSSSQTRRVINDGMKKGQLEERVFLKQCNAGHFRPCAFYRIL